MNDLIEAERCPFGFRHSSGGNGHRVRLFRENEHRLRREVLANLAARANVENGIDQLASAPLCQRA